MRLNRLIQGANLGDGSPDVRTRAAAALSAAFQAQRSAALHSHPHEECPQLEDVRLSPDDADPHGIELPAIREATLETTRLLYCTVADDGTHFLAPDHEAALMRVLTDLWARC